MTTAILPGADRGLEATFDHAALGIAHVALDGRFLRSNRHLCEMLGYTEEELRRRTFVDVTYAPDREGDVALAARLAAGELTTYTLEKRYVRSDGSVVWGKLTASLVREDAGPPLYFVGILEDITRRKDLERERLELLEQSRCHAARLALLADASRAFAEARLDVPELLDTVAGHVAARMGDACVIRLLNPEGELERVAVRHSDPAAQDLLEEIAGSQRHRLGEAIVGRVAQSGRPLLAIDADLGELRATMPAAYGRYYDRYGRRSIAVFPLAAGPRIIGTLSAFRDGASHPYTQDDFVLLTELAERAGLAIENARLYREAVRSVQVRDEFMSIAAHELKTPLTALQLHVQALARRAQGHDEQLRERAHTAVRQVGRLTTLVDELLDVTRLGSGPLRLDPEPFDLAELVQEVSGRLEEGLRACGCPVTLHAPAPVHGRWDRLRIEQVLTNLLTNAMKYARGSPVHVRVEAAENVARLVVEDRGIGIAAADQERIFQRFERAVSSRHFGGLGLGLWITRQIVLAHGGEVHVSSAPGEGAAFTIELPLEHPRQ